MEDHSHNPGLHVLYVGWAMTHLDWLNSAIQEAVDFSNADMMDTVQSLQEARRRLIETKAHYRDAAAKLMAGDEPPVDETLEAIKNVASSLTPTGRFRTGPEFQELNLRPFQVLGDILRRHAAEPATNEDQPSEAVGEKAGFSHLGTDASLWAKELFDWALEGRSVTVDVMANWFAAAIKAGRDAVPESTRSPQLEALEKALRRYVINQDRETVRDLRAAAMRYLEER